MSLKVKEIVAVGICAFGGLSSVAQTSSVLIGTNLSVRKYIIQKLRQCIIAMILAFIVFNSIGNIIL